MKLKAFYSRNSIFAVAFAATCMPFAHANNLNSVESSLSNSRVSSSPTGNRIIEQEIHIEKPLVQINSADCDISDDPRSAACLGRSKGYQPQTNLERFVQKGASYATRFVPMANEGAGGDDYAKVIKNDGTAFLIGRINSAGTGYLNKEIQKTPFLAQTSISFNSGGSDSSVGFSVDSLMKLMEITHDSEGALSTLLFSQAKYSTSGDSDGSTTNVGIGIRNRPDDKSMLGANVFWDYKTLDYSSAHSRIGLGAEYLWKYFEFRNNWYLAWTDNKNVTIGGVDYTERVVPGWDVEIGYRLPEYPALGIFVRGFHWDYEDTQDNDGAEVSLNWQATPHVNLETWVSNEISALETKPNSALPTTDETFFGVRIKLTGQPVRFKKNQFKQNMVNQMTQPVRRRYEVLLERSAGGFQNRGKSS